MTVDVPPAGEEKQSSEAEPARSVDDLLRDLLVEDRKVRVDPVSGDVDPAPEKSP